METTRVRLAGTGGQGLLLAGVILAEAAACHHGLTVVQTQSYGPEARGGASKSDVILSTGPIYNPKPEAVDVLLVLSRPAYEKYRSDLAEGGVLLYDSGQVEPDAGDRGLGAPITALARDEIGAVITANVVALGILAGATDLVSAGALEAAVLARVPEKARDLNARALARGLEEGRRLRAGEGGAA